jgi:molybdenum cofactor cytidylyltransferase
MKFGEIPVADAVGAIVAHSIRLPDRAFRKGRVLSEADVEALVAAGHQRLVAARLEEGDVGEDRAATELAGHFKTPGVTVGKAFTGRVNCYAETGGFCLVDRAAVDRFNLVDESITLATLEPSTVVAAKQMIATVKIIPFAVPRTALDACRDVLETSGPLFQVLPFRPHRVGLIQTKLPGLKRSVLDKTAEVTRGRLQSLGSSLVSERRCEHREEALAPLVEAALAEGCDLVLVAGASAIVDRRDVIPAAIVAAGGTIDHFGMPVDPGNLMLVAHVGDRPVLGLPGCARSPKENGFDWLLRRVLAGLPADAAAIRRMGVGGLLGEIPSRPLPRAQAVVDTPPSAEAPPTPRAPRIAGLVLAAGKSSRMGTLNKLLIVIDGKPMVRHVVDAVLAAGVAPLVVVTGHQQEQVAAALAGVAAEIVDNPAFAQGLSTSLKRGLAALPDDVDAALVCLGDMPRVTPAEIERLVAAFNPVEGRGIIVPTWHGKRGNPVLWARRFFAEMGDVAGDVGARHLIGAYPEAVVEIEMEGDAVLTDIDTPQALARLAAIARIEV